MGKSLSTSNDADIRRSDAVLHSSSGPGNPIAAATGWPFIKEVSDLFQAGPGKTTANGTIAPPPLIIGFSVRPIPLLSTN